MAIIIIALVTFVFLYGVVTYASNRKTERQSFTVIKEEGGFEIRQYQPAVMATVSSPLGTPTDGRNHHFRQLAGYIFGGNKSRQKIAMTAPVYMEQSEKATTMSFVLPAGYQLGNLPIPDDSGIVLHESEGGCFGALRFGGFAADKKIASKERELAGLLAKAGYEVTGNFKYLGYNAPWDIFGRDNDIIVPIKLK